MSKKKQTKQYATPRACYKQAKVRPETDEEKEQRQVSPREAYGINLRVKQLKEARF
jgi:hypothetical protein